MAKGKKRRANHTAEPTSNDDTKEDRKVKMTITAIKEAEPKETAYILWDTEVKGFGCRRQSFGR